MKTRGLDFGVCCGRQWRVPGRSAIVGRTTAADNAWQVGTPIVTYWAGPAMTDATATQMAEGGWNVVWCSEQELDVAQRHGLRHALCTGSAVTACVGRSCPAESAR